MKGIIKDALKDKKMTSQSKEYLLLTSLTQIMSDEEVQFRAMNFEEGIDF